MLIKLYHTNRKIKCKNINEVPLIETKVENYVMKHIGVTKFYVLILTLRYKARNWAEQFQSHHIK